jgi:hypothetical protein
MFVVFPEKNIYTILTLIKIRVSVKYVNENGSYAIKRLLNKDILHNKIYLPIKTIS